MTATLEERLNYLVNYSSQLIFVSGDSLADQTQALEQTLFQQSENTELAYLVADESFEISDYRRLLCQQLLGVPRGQLSRPLNECLAALNLHEGPVMIAITRAEKMSNDVLQELWELVLQSRFAGNKQHLNVVLFGETQWALQAKKWLPANNTGTPLLLSSQKTSYSPFTESYADSRPLASEEQQIQAIEQRPIVTMGAFWAATILVFLCVLSGIGVWLYGEKTSSLFSPISQPSISILPEISSTETVLDWEAPNKELNAEQLVTEEPVREEVIAESQTTEPVSEEQAQEEPIEPVSSPNVAETETAAKEPVHSFTEGNYFIQIAGLQDAKLLSRFLNDNNLQDKTQIYETQRYGGRWFVVLMSPAYDTIDEARNALGELPSFQNRDQAFIKSSGDILKELSLISTTDPN